MTPKYKKIRAIVISLLIFEYIVSLIWTVADKYSLTADKLVELGSDRGEADRIAKLIVLAACATVTILWGLFIWGSYKHSRIVLSIYVVIGIVAMFRNVNDEPDWALVAAKIIDFAKLVAVFVQISLIGSKEHLDDGQSMILPGSPLVDPPSKEPPPYEPQTTKLIDAKQ